MNQPTTTSETFIFPTQEILTSLFEGQADQKLLNFSFLSMNDEGFFFLKTLLEKIDLSNREINLEFNNLTEAIVSKIMGLHQNFLDQKTPNSVSPIFRLDFNPLIKNVDNLPMAERAFAKMCLRDLLYKPITKEFHHTVHVIENPSDMTLGQPKTQDSVQPLQNQVSQDRIDSKTPEFLKILDLINQNQQTVIVENPQDKENQVSETQDKISGIMKDFATFTLNNLQNHQGRIKHMEMLIDRLTPLVLQHKDAMGRSALEMEKLKETTIGPDRYIKKVSNLQEKTVAQALIENSFKNCKILDQRFINSEEKQLECDFILQDKEKNLIILCEVKNDVDKKFEKALSQLSRRALALETDHWEYVHSKDYAALNPGMTDVANLTVIKALGGAIWTEKEIAVCAKEGVVVVKPFS